MKTSYILVMQSKIWVMESASASLLCERYC